MSNPNTNSKLLLITLILTAVAGLAYYMLSGKIESSDTQNTPATATEQAAPAAEETATPPSDKSMTEATPDAPKTEAEKSAVVATKTLDLPAAPAPDIPVSDIKSSPEVEAMMGVRKLGSDSAPIKVVEYSSLTCSHCSAFHKQDFPKIKAEYIDTGKVQFIFKELPLNKPAVDASMLLRCMPEDKFITFQSLLFDEQEKWAYGADYLSALKQNAELAGLSVEQTEKCLANKDLEARLIGDMKAATDRYKIQSTPTFVINDGAKTIVGHQPITFFEETFNAILSGNAPVAAPEEKKE